MEIVFSSDFYALAKSLLHPIDVIPIFLKDDHPQLSGCLDPSLHVRASLQKIDHSNLWSFFFLSYDENSSEILHSSALRS
jgi:hypothetical protein